MPRRRHVKATYNVKGVRSDARMCRALFTERSLTSAAGRRLQAIIAEMSDDCLADNVIVPYGVTWLDSEVQVVSLDHAMWFHEPARADEWIYCEQRPLAARSNRGTAEARFWQNGRLVATAVREALARL